MFERSKTAAAAIAIKIKRKPLAKKARIVLEWIATCAEGSRHC